MTYEKDLCAVILYGNKRILDEFKEKFKINLIQTGEKEIKLKSLKSEQLKNILNKK